MKIKIVARQFSLYMLFGCLLCSQVVFSQLSNFNLIVTKTDETCSGNGTLNFNVSNTSPGAIVVYSIYLLPNSTNPIAVTSSNSITGLVTGNYRVKAVQSLGSLFNFKQEDIQILNLINPLVYQVTGQPLDCINGNITINVTQGNPATYEIISGPEIIAPQISNVFVGLAVGEYVIRVNDICGDGIVQTFTLTRSSSLSISPIEQSCFPISCLVSTGQIKISTALGSTIYYPLSVETTIFQPNGEPPVITTQTITSGTVSIPPAVPYTTASLNLQIVNGLTYSYNIRVIDACGNTFVYNGNDLIRIGRIELIVTSETPETPEAPGHLSYITIGTCNLVPPLLVNFLDAPVGFNPSFFNSEHPGPFAFSTIRYESNSEHQLPFGHYEVEVTDSCGTVSVGDGMLSEPNCKPDITATPICGTFALVRIRNITTLIITSAPVGFNFPIPYDATSAIVDNTFLMQLPLGTYTFEGIDSCGGGNEYKLVSTIDLPTYSISAENQDGCESNTGTIKIKYNIVGLELAIVGVRILTAPTEFLYPLPFNATQYILLPISRIEVEITGLPPGDYMLEVIDFCGNVYPLSVTVPVKISIALPTVSLFRGCTDGLGSIFIDTPNRKFTQVKITTAPVTFTQTLPYNVTFNISAQGKFYMNGLPEGTYTFETLDVCGITNTFQVEIPGYNVVQSDVYVIGNCGSFDIVINHSIDQPYFQIFWLQKFDALTNQWKHPYTGVIFANGDQPNNSNSFQVYNFSTNLNFALNGKFRVVKVNLIYSNGNSALTNCDIVVIKEFEFTGELKIINATKIACTDGSYNAFITVAGIPPFTFKITSKDGQPFLVDNGNSNYFSNLIEGTYNFQIQDVCGNVLNRVYDIVTLLEPSISQSRLCDGQNGKLIVPDISFLSYQWWNGSAPSVILSTTNTLNFTPFNSSVVAGTYFVRIFSPSSLSCLDKILSYTIPTVSNPQAGNDATLPLCGTLNSINLFTLLDGIYDSTGNWEEITNSGMLTGATWVPSNVPYGIYKFKYRVNGFCDDFDDAIITITLKEIPRTPIIDSNSFFCFNQSFQFNVNSNPNVNFEWSGPNGFSSNQQSFIIQNPTLNDQGLYTVIATLDGCESSTSIPLIGKSVPDFDMLPKCFQNVYNVTVIPKPDSFDVANATYLWTGPDNYSSTLNPINITGFRSGEYTVTVTNPGGCSLSKSVTVNNTFCGTIPIGISPNDDGYNETFDLTGLGAEIKFKIFNRYGTMVFEQDNYTNQWHGQDYNDHILPDATYFYYIRLKSGEEKTGWVYVTR